MPHEKKYTHEEYESLPSHIKYWTARISECDNRSAHPEDYVNMAHELLSKASDNQYIAEVLFSRIITLSNNPKCHTEITYSFLDFFEYVLGRKC